jgi:transcriptional regulator with PAS, ATPase and Fis domain
MSRLEDSFKAYQSEIAKMYTASYRFEDIITINSKLISLKQLGQTIAKSDASVLIQGESGTGKELFSQAIHNASLVSNHPFISINCSSIPKQLLESELFGYESGAFTGARKDGRIGKFELAGEGTIFLDELGTMPLEMQVKLLRVLESKEFFRLGGNKKIPMKARVIAATNANLSESIKNGTFRSDLYYRLNVINIEIPPLRERLEDIPLLCENLLAQKNNIYHTSNLYMSEEALALLNAHNWPGNVRELRNVIERAALICETDEILPQHLPDYIQAYRKQHLPEAAEGYYHHEIASLERQLITKALKDNQGNRQAAARQLGIHRSLLYKKIKDLKIIPDD